MKLNEKVHQIYRLGHDAAWLQSLAVRPRTPSPELNSLPKKPYRDMEVQTSAEEQIIYLMADTVISAHEDWQLVIAREFLKLRSVSNFMKESEWQGISVHEYMLPHLVPDAQIFVFKSLCDLSQEKSDDFGSAMCDAVKDMNEALRSEAVDYIQKTKFMTDLQRDDRRLYASDMSRLYALLPEDEGRKGRSELNQFFRRAANENRETNPDMAADLLKAARIIGKGRHAERALV